MNHIGLNFVLPGGGFGVAVEPGEVPRLIELFNQRALPIILGNHNVRCRHDVVPWAIRSEQIVGVHAFDAPPPRFDAGVQQSPLAPPVPGVPRAAPWQNSGIPF